MTATETRRRRKELTVAEMRELLDDLYYEIDNRGGHEGKVFRRAFDAVAWLVGELFGLERRNWETYGEAYAREKRAEKQAEREAERAAASA